ncbi:MAG: hypothetical protein M3517_04610 [Actinomycetota bacterium]|nr:hypothetical protein [Actinomycetota bacterium]
MNLAVGSYIQEWRDKPGVREVAYVDPRTRAERSRYTRLRSELIRKLEAADLVDLVPLVDKSMFALAVNPELPGAAKTTITRMRRLGVPAAVFVGMPEAVLES